MMKLLRVMVIAAALTSIAIVSYAGQKAIKSKADVSYAGQKATKSKAEKGNEEVWLTDFKKASEIAQEKNLYMFVLFTGSDWCPWCVKLEKEILSKKRFLNFAKKHFVLVFIDFPNSKPQSDELKRQNQMLSQMYGVRGFPTILIMNGEGKVLGRTGYASGGASKFVKHLKKLLVKIKRQQKKSAKKL